MEERRFRFVVLLIQSFFLATNACPNGWVQHDSSCYHISRESETWISAMDRFIIWKEIGSWRNATKPIYGNQKTKTCELFGGELATIQSDREEQFVVNQLKIANVDRYYWIGGTDLIVEGEWVWAISGGRIMQVFWNPGEPNNDNGQHCLIINKDESYQWDDYQCNSNNHYVCEQPVDGSQSTFG